MEEDVVTTAARAFADAAENEPRDGRSPSINTNTSSDRSSSVKVAVRVRPLSESEAVQSSERCVRVTSATRVVLGAKQFDFDAAFATDASQQHVYEQVVAPLVDRFFEGYNATVLAYGQTGSGKTFTMGNDFKLSAASENRGIIPRTMEAIFARVEAASPTARTVVKVSYLEILNEEIYDLLASAPGATATSGLTVRDEGKRGIVVAGLREHSVASLAQVASLLATGALQRATAATTMNAHSSRSHAVCTLTMTQHSSDDDGDDSTTRVSKFHLVDLAGSERAKRTLAHGARFREGVNINRGLLALGNVIHALSDRSPSTSSATASTAATTHVPYRDSKLTRLLADSLGGNSKTLMVACVSPARVNTEETANTLRYAARARRIENAAVVNVDRSEVAVLRQQVLALQQQLDGTFRASVQRSSADTVDALERELAMWKRVASARAGELRAVRDQWHRVADHVLRVQSGSNGSNVSEADNALRTAMTLARDALACDAAAATSSELPLLLPVAAPVGTQQLRADLASLSDVIVEKEKIALALAAQPTASAAEAHLADLAASYDRSVRELERRVAALAHELEHAPPTSSDANTNDADASIDDPSSHVRAQLAALQRQLEVAQRAAAACRDVVALGGSGATAIAALERELVDLRKQRTALQRRLRDECEAHRRATRAHAQQILQLQRHDQRQQLELQRLAAAHAKQHNVLKRKTEEVALANKRMRTMAPTPAKAAATPIKTPVKTVQSALLRAVNSSTGTLGSDAAARVLQCSASVQRAVVAAKRALDRTSNAEADDAAAVTLRRTLAQTERIGMVLPDDALPLHIVTSNAVIRALLDATAACDSSSSSCAHTDTDTAAALDGLRSLEVHRVALEHAVAALEREVRALVTAATPTTAMTTTSSRFELQSELAAAQREIETLRRELAAAATILPKPKPKPRRAAAAAEDLDDSIVVSSSPSSASAADDSDSDYEDVADAAAQRRGSNASGRRAPRLAASAGRLVSVATLTNTNSGDLMDDIDALLALPSVAGVPLCCACAGKCATRACACKEARSACGATCACSTSRCLNRDVSREAVGTGHVRPSQQHVDGSREVTSSKTAKHANGVRDKENAAPVTIVTPATPLSKLEQLWPRASAAAAGLTPKTPQRRQREPQDPTTSTTTTPKSLIKPPSRRFVLQSITASAQKQIAALTAHISTNSATGGNSTSTDRIDRFL